MADNAQSWPGLQSVRGLQLTAALLLAQCDSDGGGVGAVLCVVQRKSATGVRRRARIDAKATLPACARYSGQT